MADDLLSNRTKLARVTSPGFNPAQMSVIVAYMAIAPDNSANVAVASTAAQLVTLLKRIESKDREAFDRFYDLTVNKMYHYTLRFTQQHEMVEEVISDVYLRVWRKAASFEASRGNVLAWLTIMCRSHALDALRRTCSSEKLVVSLALEEKSKDQASAEQPQDFLQTVERNTELYNALEQLTEQQRQLLSMAYFRGFSHSELATILGLPLGTVKTQLRRTVEKLKIIMTGETLTGVSDE
ncbi:MAG: RNA polymerase sigma factor [Thiohalomonadales bacterium]